jgi:hypothetical protein
MLFRTIRILVAAAAIVALTVPAAGAAPRMLMGFQDDPSFRWAKDSHTMLDRAAQTGVSIIRTTADWNAIAPTKPANPTDSFDPAYQLADFDELARSAQQRGLELLITIWGTPKWANGGKGPNVAPRNVADLKAFAQALADRYSGRHTGFPYVARWSVWNEPNLDLFLTPQFSRSGKIVGPALYAKLYRAAYAGIKAGNPAAQVAIGETSARGRDRKLPGVSGSISPGRFAELLAKAAPTLKFDAWAQHPYPTVPNMKPLQRVKWPNVTLPSLKKFETSLDRWFHRKGIPIWITEYGHETKPGEPRGVTVSQQRAYAATAINYARRDPRVQMFIWFILRDDASSKWQSGLYSQNDAAKPALATWSSLASLVNGVTVKVKAGRPNPVVRVAMPKLAYYAAPGELVGMTYRVYDGSKLIAVSQPAVPLGSNGSISIPLAFTPVAGKTYTLKIEANGASGATESVTAALVSAK